MRFRNDYYQLLGVPVTAEFDDLKRAYYRRAKQCHPDRHRGCPQKEEEFKLLVEAFDVLSDPVRRRQFDGALGAAPPAPSGSHLHVRDSSRRSILDSLADDDLEELIVGNTIPEKTTLQTLMLDLEKTERFCLFREAKTCYYKGRFGRAESLLTRAVGLSPQNILYRYFLGRTLCKMGQEKKAIGQFKVALHIGMCRIPPLRLPRIRREMTTLQEQHGGLAYQLLRHFRGKSQEVQPADIELRDQLERCLSRLAPDKRRSAKRGKPLPKLPLPPKRLTPPPDRDREEQS